MLGEVKSEHFVDADGNPAGGNTWGAGFSIGWQHGPLGRPPERRDPNGAFVETIIKAAFDRLEFYQSTKFNCHANALAMSHLEAALDELNSRTVEREKRQVEGTHCA